MTARDYLGQARTLDKRIEMRCEEIARLRARMEGAGKELDGMPHGGSGGDWTDVSVKVMEQEERLRGEILELCRLKREIGEAIDAVEDARHRAILEMRYRNYMSWEQIAVNMNYAYRHVIRLHGEALLCVRVPERCP